jgi:anti-sigma B factor antagonist
VGPHRSIIPRRDSQPHRTTKLAHGCVVGLQISIRESGDVTILDLRGRSSEPSACELLRSNLQKLVANGARKVLLDITDLTLVDSYCVTLIVRTHASLRSQGGDLKLLHPGGHVLEVFRMLHLLKLIPSFEDETEALASFGPVSCSGKLSRTSVG